MPQPKETMLRNIVEQYERLVNGRSIPVRRFFNFVLQAGGNRKRSATGKNTAAAKKSKISNWEDRYPKIVDMLQKSECQVITLQEIEPDISVRLEKDLPMYNVYYTKHPEKLEDGRDGRVDGVAVLIHKDLKVDKVEVIVGNFVNSLLVTFQIEGETFSVCSTHQKGQIDNQLSSLLDGLKDYDNLILGGDFNTDFSDPANNKKYEDINEKDKKRLEKHNLWHDPGRDTLRLGDTDSRPSHKQNPEQTSGKGCVDWIFARQGKKVLETFYDIKCRKNIVKSRNGNKKGRKWFSDHDFHCVCVRIGTTKLLRIGQYNILSDFYGMKWNEQEAYKYKYN